MAEQTAANQAAVILSALPAVEVQLAGRTYQVQPLPYMDGKAWRQRLEEPLGGFAQLVSRVGDLDGMSPAGIAGVLYEARALLLGSLDLVVELLLAYAPAIKADWDAIGNAVYDLELVDAFLQILPLAYPLEQLGARLKPLLGRLPR